MGKTQNTKETPYQRSYIYVKLMKRSSSSFVIRELQNKTIMSCHYTPIRMVKIPNKIHSTKRYWGFWAAETLFHWEWEHKMPQPLRKIVWQSFTKLNMVLPQDPVIMLLVIYSKLIWKPIFIQKPACGC